MIDQHQFQTWRDFKGAFPALFGGMAPLMRRLVFRGMADADWHLVSSFDRCYPRPDNKRQDSYRYYLKFFQTLNMRLGKQLPTTEDEMGALAQHYGMPTRLLDWSLSPYTAAFFAFFYAKILRTSCSHVAVWALDSPSFSSEVNPQHFEIVRTQNEQNPRIHRQIGSFIAARGSYYDLNDYVTTRSFKQTLLHRCIIPVTETDEALNDLLLMGQTPADIYPDFEGVAMYVRLRMAFEGYKI